MTLACFVTDTWEADEPCAGCEAHGPVQAGNVMRSHHTCIRKESSFQGKRVETQSHTQGTLMHSLLV